MTGAHRRPNTRPRPAGPAGQGHRPTARIDDAALFDRAVSAQGAGRLDEAEAAYRALLAREPGHVGALNNLAVLCRRQSQPERAAALLKRAVALAPGDAKIHKNLGLALYDATAYAQAMAHLRHAVEARPDDPALLVRLSKACLYDNRNEEAAAFAQRLVAVLPDSAAAHRHLGWMLVSAKRPAEARAAFSRARDLDPTNEEAAYMLTVLDGGMPPAAAHTAVTRASYAANAAVYETVTVPLLQNRTPQLLRGLLDATAGPDFRAANALDLACGTGLMGLQIRPLTRRLTGVDLSPEMAAQAERKGIYDRLATDDAVTFLGSERESYDLVTCSDALIHFGDLAPLFDAVLARVRPGALLLFSVEHHDGEGYLIDPTTVRFRHGHPYITTLLQQHGCRLLAHRLATIRVDRGAAVTGGLYLARAP